MEEQSDTPRTEMAEGQRLNPYFEGRFDGESVELRALRLTLVRERDEAQAEGVEQARLLGISGSREAALMAKVDAITRERDEARAIANDRDAMVDHRDRALTAMYQRVDVITRERDEARAEVERLRSTLIDVVNQIRKCDPVDELGHRMTMNRACLEAETLLDSAATEAARKFCGVGELERAGYIPAGSADEREAKP